MKRSSLPAAARGLATYTEVREEPVWRRELAKASRGAGFSACYDRAMKPVVRIRRHIESDTLVVPELEELLGCDVEIEIRPVELTGEEIRSRLRGSVLRYDDPFGPADEEGWEANS